jgi:DNA-binding NarL/FixJ family response regulator
MSSPDVTSGVSTLYRKLNVSSRPEAAARAIKMRPIPRYAHD